MASIFSKIVAGEIPSYKIAENEHCYAFLDINPLAEGHTLVIPKQETDYIFDLEDNLYLELMHFSKRVANAIDTSCKCERVGIAVIGLEVPHAHVHLVPINGLHDIDFSKPPVKLSQDQFLEISKTISSNFNLTV